MNKRIPQLDGLRALAVLCVFLRHALDVRLMWIGVDIFFVLSGFLITGVLLDMQKTNLRAYLGRFYERRARRILPPWALLLVAGSLLFGLSWTKYWYMYFFLANYTFFYFPDGSFPPFDMLWSLAVEEQFYLVWPLVVFWVSQKRLPGILVAIMLTAPLLRGLVAPWAAHQYWDKYHWFIYKGTPFRMDCLAVGGLLTFFWRRHEEKVRRYGHFGLCVAMLALASIILLDRRFGGLSTSSGTIRGSVVTLELTLFAATGIFLWALGGQFTRLLTIPPMQALGRISYTFYLIHWSFIQLAQIHLHQSYWIVLISFAMSVCYASASWYWMERPILSSSTGGTK